MIDITFKEWLAEIMMRRPKNNSYLDSERGIEVGKLCIAVERELHSWRRSDVDTFWIDVQLFTKFKLDDNEIIFILKQQPGINNYAKHSLERKAYAEMMRGLKKLREFIEGEDDE